MEEFIFSGLYDSLGAGIIFLAVLAITFESSITQVLKSLWLTFKNWGYYQEESG